MASKTNTEQTFTVVDREPAVRGRGTDDPRVAAMVAALVDSISTRYRGFDGLTHNDEKAARDESQAVRKHLANALGIPAREIRTRVSPRGKGQNKRYTWEIKRR
jgi:hypothetical protein